jgi:hypothetical protein
LPDGESENLPDGLFCRSHGGYQGVDAKVHIVGGMSGLLRIPGLKSDIA